MEVIFPSLFGYFFPLFLFNVTNDQIIQQYAIQVCEVHLDLGVGYVVMFGANIVEWTLVKFCLLNICFVY